MTNRVLETLLLLLVGEKARCKMNVFVHMNTPLHGPRGREAVVDGSATFRTAYFLK